MFVDTAMVAVKAGDGGNGRASFRHEKFLQRGGPDGGDGGHGGSIIFQASDNENTLANFRVSKVLKAGSGEPGGKNRRHGKNGPDLVVKVPVGTVITDGTGKVLADLKTAEAPIIIAAGGRGGFGNAHFVSSVRQAPQVAEKGELGERLELSLELKMIADVGLVGMPNAGKSTLLSVISAARPDIADYPFTTLTPNLGVVDVDKKNSLLFADIPGLIEGAASGKGLGDDFLRHIERTQVLVHLIDAYEPDVVKAYQTVQAELKAYKLDLSRRPQVVVLTKVEGLDQDIIDDLIKQLRTFVPKSTEILAVSAQAHLGIDNLIHKVWQKLQAKKRRQQKSHPAKEADLPVLSLPPSGLSWRIRLKGDVFVITGAKIERFAMRTDFNSDAGIARLRDIMRKMGIMHELKRRGVQTGQTIRVAELGEFSY